VELISPDSGDPLDGERFARIKGRIVEEGVLVGGMSHCLPGPESMLFLSPPLVLTQAEADKIIAAFEAAIT